MKRLEIYDGPDFETSVWYKTLDFHVITKMLLTFDEVKSFAVLNRRIEDGCLRLISH